MKGLLLKTLKLFAFTLPFLSFTTQSQPNKPLKIYVMQVIQHPALDASRQGIYDELVAQGLKPDVDFVWIYESAQGNPSLASQIAQKAVGNKADVIVTLGTMVSQAAVIAAQHEDIPVLFASVTDPLGAKIVRSMDKPGYKVSGVSNLTPSAPQFEMFRKIQPGLKSLGIIYSPGEANSIALNEEMKQAAAKMGIELVFAPAVKTSDVAAATAKIIDKVDAFFVNNDAIGLAAFPSIVQVATPAGKPVYVSDTDMVEQGGALAAMGPGQYELGRQTGAMVIKVLNGADPAQMPVEHSQVRRVVVNPAMAKKLGMTLPPVKDLEK